jgi:hypothetical protein
MVIAMAEELWREIPGFNGHYEVSNLGRIRSWYWRKGDKRQEEPRYNKCFVTNVGYIRCRLQRNRSGENYLVHRLVMLAFVGDSELTVNHKDGDKTNNQLDNLEYLAHRDNVKYSFTHLGRKGYGRRGALREQHQTEMAIA